ncbi:hypothetical protein [Sulfuriroseicoccus oceanibius]|uniref:Uncharacterized protein n=1 Tax=Sulfuriroseicoccus oceanibius TaxID=2707525 RepID=A0A6B3L333_9BACT|nr:hypothetical protein [Sulfuriroseicoccus oceanibius]QQL45501.1 hypothetical protein G3M56_002615 [Sulfuriroseicoccus oceanibius]
MKKIIGLLCVMFLVLPVCAQSGGQAVRTYARFLYLKKHQSTPSELLVMGRKGPEEIRISGRAPGEYVVLPSNGQIIVGTPGADEENPIIPLVSKKVPAGATKVLVLLAPIADGKYSAMLLDEREFKGGSIFFINNSGEGIGVAVDEKKWMVRNRSTKLVQLKVDDDARNTHVSFHVQSDDPKKGNRLKLLGEHIWNIDPKRGEICVFYRDEIRNRSAYKVFASYFYPIERDRGSSQGS